LQTLRKKLQEKRAKFPNLPTFEGSTLYEFADQITGPIHGFEGADDYYHQCSSAFFMDQIRTDTLVVHSREDPMCPFKWTPMQQIEQNSKIRAHFTDKGGHVGFWSLPNGWINQKIGDYFTDFI